MSARGIVTRALLTALGVYQAFFSALMPSACKFYPTCSHYAAGAIEVHGARRGSWLALRRLSRCHPFTRGGVDLVPDAPESSLRANDAGVEPQFVSRDIERTEAEVHS